MPDVLGGVAATFSKSPRFWSGDPDWQPREVVAGRGATVFGTDNRYYLDWVSGLGAVLLGYPSGKIDGRFTTAADCWADRVSEQVYEGVGFSLPHIREASVAERLETVLANHVPGWQSQPLSVRWLKTGSDACMAAVRLARAVTGRQWVISVGYHGYHDWAVSTSPPAWGVEPGHSVEAIPFSDVSALQYSLERQDWERRALTSTGEGGKVAAVIIEQPPQPAPEGYWQTVQRLCREHGALLIADEVVTGLRYAMGGACERFGIEPDIICMAKALGNGLPIAAIVGRREYWEWFARTDPVFISSTSFGDAVSLAAADAVLDLWDQECVGHIWHIGVHLMAGLKLAGYQVTGYPPISLIEHESPSHHAFFIREMAKHGVLMNRPNIPNLAHTDEDLIKTIEAAREVKAAMATADVEAEMAGKLPMQLFNNR